MELATNYGPGRTRNAPQEPLVLAVVRPLVEGDMFAIAGIQRGDQGGTSLAPIKRIAARHHQAAQLICIGKTDVETAMLTGYTPQHVRNLKSDPAFGELMRHYSVQRDVIIAPVVEQMKIAGSSALAELQDRLENAPNSWSKKDLMEYVKLTVTDPLAQAKKSGADQGGQPSVQVNLKFIASGGAGAPVLSRPEMRDITLDSSEDD